MPPRGGNPKLDDAALRDAITYMAGAALKAPAGPATARPAAAPANAAVAAVAASAAVPATPATANNFNRLLRAPGRRNLAPTEDNIHDPANDATAMLQPPLVAFEALPRSNAGNRVDWVKAIGGGHIVPRADRLDPAAQPMVMDLNIVREVKGSMPDVVYPHKQHTEWLDCSNCHPAIFIPQKGANQISMAAILLGEKCGVCHGKVAFPVSECRLCHSKPKPAAVTPVAGKP
jgi:c(7)-type cytochrome triheme protein